jgi:hypothetical protein
MPQTAHMPDMFAMGSKTRPTQTVEVWHNAVRRGNSKSQRNSLLSPSQQKNKHDCRRVVTQKSTYLSSTTSKTQRFLDLFISINCSTCFRRFLRPSSGAQNCRYSVRYCQTNTAAIVDEMELLVISLQYNQQDATFSRSVYFYKLLYMFQMVPPPIIRSTKLYIQHQVLSNQYCCYRGWDGTTFHLIHDSSRQQYWFDNTWCCMYSFVLLMMSAGTAWNM